MTRLPLAIVLIPLALAHAAGKPNPYLAQARVFYQGAEFKKCLDRLKQAEKWDSTVREQAEVSLYQGLCRFYVKKVAEAESDFVRALELDPTLELPAATSPKIVEVWKRARAVVPAPEPPAPPPVAVADPEPVVTPPPRAPAPTEVAATPTPEAPPRVPVLAITSGGVAVAASIAAVSFGLIANSNDATARSATFQSDAITSRSRAETFALVTNVSWGVAAAAAVTALVLLLLQR